MDSDVAPLPTFPPAQQAQIIRANQRDLFYVSSLREQAENVLRAWLGNRWLSRWDKELDLLSKLLYFGLTTGRAAQTLGEEYTNIWRYAEQSRGFPSPRRRAALVFLPALPAYIISRFSSTLSGGNRKLERILGQLPGILDVLSEINLAIFYFSGVYYDLVRRLLRVRNVSSIPENPNARPPSYSLLGILIMIRLIHRLVSTVRSFRVQSNKGEPSPQPTPRLMNGVKERSSAEATIDGVSLSELLAKTPNESDPSVPAEEDEHTALDFASISSEERGRRNCTLCLEERTSSCATECGHMFCWPCIIGWGREKAECPLCRQSLNLARLLPIYNL